MPSRYLSSADIDAMIARTAPAVRKLLADGVPRNRKGIVEALAGRHGKDDVVRTVMRMSVTGQLDERRARFDRETEAVRMAVEHIPARTLAGAAVKRCFVLCQLDEAGTVRRAIVAGQPIDGAAVKAHDWRSGMLLRVLEDLERMAAA